MTASRRWLPLLLAAVLYLLVSAVPWHGNSEVRSATALAVAALVLWASECAPLGAIALGIPIAASLSGLLTWKEAIVAWSEPSVFLFLGAFLLARAIEKHGVLDAVLAASSLRRRLFHSPLRLSLSVMLFAGAISTLQNNTAVTAMLLPVVVSAARSGASPALPLLALSFGATFGGMATPVGTAPNVIGYGAAKQIDASFGFIRWMAVGLPVWLGCSLIGLAGLRFAMGLGRWLEIDAANIDSFAAESGKPRANFAGRRAADDEPVDSVATIEKPSKSSGRAPDSHPDAFTRRARCIALAACGITAMIWLTSGFIAGVFPANHALRTWLDSRLPESLVPIAAAWMLFMLPLDRAGRAVLERDDLRRIDWDTLFLIAGGFCLGRALENSGTAGALGQAVAQSGLTGLQLMFALGAVTVLLSEITSNTVTAALLVPVAKALSAGAGLDPTQTIVLVALCASLGFAMPISTPPNALIYGTGLVPLRLMMCVGIFVDLACIVWVTICVRGLM